jgi:single-strand DNA-binding protein
MAAGDTQITIAGNLVDDPELRFTPAGQPVAKFRIASTPRYLDKTTNEWKDGDSLFLTCNVWRQAAENVAESLTRGMRVIVSGRLRQRSYETKEGEKRTVYEVEVDDVGPSLRNASAKVNRVPAGTAAATAAAAGAAASAVPAVRAAAAVPPRAVARGIPAVPSPTRGPRMDPAVILTTPRSEHCCGVPEARDTREGFGALTCRTLRDQGLYQSEARRGAAVRHR